MSTEVWTATYKSFKINILIKLKSSRAGIIIQIIIMDIVPIRGDLLCRGYPSRKHVIRPFISRFPVTTKQILIK